MTTLAKHIIVAGAENRPPMLEKSMYDSWASRIRLFIKGNKHGRMMLDSIDNDDCDVQATNIILQGLPPDVYALVNHQEAAKDIWDRGEILYEYYWRFSQLINDMHTIRMTMQQVQVNTKFLNAFPSEFTPVYAAPIHHPHPRTPVNPVNSQQHLVFPSPFISPLTTPQSQAEFPQLDSGLAISMFQQGEDLIECINKVMTFLSAVASRFPPSNNQLRTSSNLRNQATIQDGRVTVQQVQGRQIQSYAGTGNRGIATTSKGNGAVGPSRVVKCYNCQGEGHLARQCTQPKRPRNDAWFKEKMMLAEAQEAGQILDEEQLAFLADPAKAVLVTNLSSCDPEVLSENSKQTHVDDFEDNEIHSGSNIISYSQYLQETQDAVIQDTNPSTPNDLLVLSLVEQMTDHVAHLDKEN
ncbi:integrase, catalytic region, zinc finger, CCHC-type containing protein [Tanacetum coccineum]